MLVRDAIESDYEGLSKLCKCLGFEADDSSMKARIKMIKGFDYHKILVAEEADNLLGFVHFFDAPSLLTERTVEIGGLAVIKEHRRKNIATLLMLEAEKWASKQGCSSILLATHESRNEAVKFYQSLGYETEFKTYFMRKSI